MGLITREQRESLYIREGAPSKPFCSSVGTRTASATPPTEQIAALLLELVLHGLDLGRVVLHFLLLRKAPLVIIVVITLALLFL